MPELNTKDWLSSFWAKPASSYSYGLLQLARSLIFNEQTSVQKRECRKEGRLLTAAVREHPGFGVGMARLI